MDRIVKGCGNVSIALGIISLIVVIATRLGGARAGSWSDADILQATLLFSGALGAIVSGIFFLGLGEIISRLPPRETTKNKNCPQCAELVKVEARRCRYCGYDFPAVQAQSLGLAGAEDATSKLMACPSCGRQIPRNLTHCTFCRADLRAA